MQRFTSFLNWVKFDIAHLRIQLVQKIFMALCVHKVFSFFNIPKCFENPLFWRFFCSFFYLHPVGVFRKIFEYPHHGFPRCGPFVDFYGDCFHFLSFVQMYEKLKIPAHCFCTKRRPKPPVTFSVYRPPSSVFFPSAP